MAIRKFNFGWVMALVAWIMSAFIILFLLE